MFLNQEITWNSDKQTLASLDGWNLSSYLDIAEAVEVEVGGGKESLQGVAECSELVKDDVVTVDPTAGEDPDDSHGQVGQQEGHVEHTEQVYQILVSLRNNDLLLVSVENPKYSLVSGFVLLLHVIPGSSNSGSCFLHFPDDDVVEDDQKDGGDNLHDELCQDCVDYPGVAAHDFLLGLCLVPAVCAQEAVGAPAVTLAPQQGKIVEVVNSDTSVDDLLLPEPRDLYEEGAGEGEGYWQGGGGVPVPGGVHDGPVPVQGQQEDDEARGGDEGVPKGDINVTEVELHLILHVDLSVDEDDLKAVT